MLKRVNRRDFAFKFSPFNERRLLQPAYCQDTKDFINKYSNLCNQRIVKARRDKQHKCTARECIELLDPSSFREFDQYLVNVEPEPAKKTKTCLVLEW